MIRGAVALAIIVATTAVVAFAARPGAVAELPRLLAPEREAVAASVPDALADLPEVFALTDEGDVLPAAGSAVMPMPEAVTGPAATALYTRIVAPRIEGPRRVGLQVGHWQTEQVPPDLWRLIEATGTSWNGVREIDINLDIARRVAAILEKRGVAVDVLPATIPRGYVADAFVALHADGDGAGTTSGYKLAHGARRSPYEQELLGSIEEHYAAATGLPSDTVHTTRAMRSYYAFTWQRNAWSTAPHTPSVILEMGYVSSDRDRAVLTSGADVAAGGIAEGILRFLDAHPREELFGKDLLVPARPQFRPSP